MLVVISYDVKDDKRRNRIARTLLNYGSRVQYSVFEVNVGQRDLERLRKALAKHINAEADSIRFYYLCDACYNRVEVMGRGKPVEPEDEVYIV